MIENDLLDPIIKIYIQNRKKDNLIKSHFVILF